MKSFAKFTVVIPLYNHEKYIEEALLSVINQNYQIDEIIIIDDGSKDGSYQKIHNILSKHHQINLIRQENCGTAKTLNRAIDMSCSEWIAVLNSDDSFLPTKISRCAEIAKEGYLSAQSLHEIVVVQRQLLTQQRWDQLFSFENLINPAFAKS